MPDPGNQSASPPFRRPVLTAIRFWARRLPALVLAGALLGIAAGLVLGPRTTIMEPVGLAYAKALEIAVVPYLICALIGGLGALARGRMPRLLQASWPAYLSVWGVTFAAILVLAASFPETPAPVVLERVAAKQNFLDLLIPSNLMEALHRNFVPAIVVFALLYGLAIQPIPEKTTLLEMLEVLRKASAALWSWIVYLAPVGVFALFAHLAGTVQPAFLGGLVVYLCLFLSGAFLLAFVTLPWMLSRVAPVHYAEFLRELRPALLLALVTAVSAVSLPYVQKAVERLAAREGLPEAESGDVTRTALTLGYVLSQLGNYFMALFILYLCYHVQHPLTDLQTMMLPVMTLLSGFGSPSGTLNGVAFLAGWLELPGDPTNLYVETMTITRYGQVILSVVGFSFVTVLTVMLYFGRSRISLRRLLMPVAVSLGLFAAIAVAGRMLEMHLFPNQGPDPITARSVAPELRSRATLLSAGDTDTPLAGAGDLAAIHRRGKVRVGFIPDAMPFSYLSAAGDPVGFDIAAVHRLARDLDVRLELVPVEPGRIAEELAKGHHDMVVGGIYATERRMQGLNLSDFYYESPLVLVAQAQTAEDLLSYPALAAAPQLRLDVVGSEGLERLAQELFPRAHITASDSYAPRSASGAQAVVASRVRARAWALAHDGFTAVQPEGLAASLPFAYMMPAGADALTRRVNLWLALQRAEGSWDTEIGYWIHGHPYRKSDRRWNLLDDILLPWLSGTSKPLL